MPVDLDSCCPTVILPTAGGPDIKMSFFTTFPCAGRAVDCRSLHFFFLAFFTFNGIVFV
jgi:hypothetical protein